MSAENKNTETELAETRLAADGGDRVTAALNFVHAADTRDASHEWLYLDALAAEVHRLRERETALLNAGRASEARIVEIVREGKCMVEAFTRVEALLDRTEPTISCADLEAALRDEVTP